ncbi:Uncharacterised protein [Mycobacteroides abscessus subsp. bolletii]|uniref:hypothetical protein n=1 Tax=Mycobacteroides abscessus TaxID=36809 RepID=UPI0009A7475E|nr:hypothetical protein [Mycobacteroides abscessus]SKX80970.1 Uncharacterised protein [Mycobacteroides abscessus subsp. bolletii]
MTEDYIDATSTRMMVAELRMTGLSLNEISEQRLVSVESLRTLIRGRNDDGTPAPDVLYRHYESLVKAPCQPSRELPKFPEQGYDGLVLPFGTIRRLRVLVALGHSHAYLAQRIGGSPSRLSRVMNPWITGQVTAEGTERVYRTYQTLRLIAGPSEADRIDGKLRGWDIWLDADHDDFDRVVVDDYGYIENDPAVDAGGSR